ncbi:hypothetical protein PNEG_00153 [Pneumocystis murina B123]|uniref:WLM domain-containing protein n=1 Tax=Pneumocystis murina (strain B123) TaxID=1069680 RepID=M7PMM7_PNEMU|nr:hypothetical protein PNEG_00153 [Pneumocystis murina B123]EMR11719.1 hypothetical protein PNEG_00153 [Pneumocystis murina B123]
MEFLKGIPSLSPIDKCVSLKSKKRNQEAYDLLKKIESLVMPIMKSRSLEVSVLAEFFPKNDALLGLNINRGSKICIRLRMKDDENMFYPLDYLIEIMLHELTHNVYSSHDAKFYGKLFFYMLNELNLEFNQLLCSGNIKNQFYSKDYKVGENISRNSLYHKTRVLEEKKLSNTLTNGSGSRLGGTRNVDNKPLRDLIREATEKRIKNLKWCMFESNIVIEDDEIYDGPKNDIFSSELLESGSDLNNPQLKKKIKVLTSKPKFFQKDIIPEDLWSCTFCTFKNNGNYLQCEACLSERSFNVFEFFNKKWNCIICSNLNEKQQYSCEFCNTIRT